MSQDDRAAYVDVVTQRGQEAAAALMGRLKLPAGDPVLLSSRGNLVVRFPAAGLVARVATLTAWSRLEPELWLAREVAVARHVAGRGGPVIPPARGSDPGPYRQDGFVISLWEYVPPRAGRPDPATAGRALARFHRAARDFPGVLGCLSPAREQISDGLTVLERENVTADATIAALRAEHARTLAGIEEVPGAGGPTAVLHGDAHPGNLLAAPGLAAPGLAAPGGDGTWLWTDLEETARGPAAWDLAVLSAYYGANDPRSEMALRAYADEAGSPVPGEAELAPFRRARELEAVVWALAMAHLYPARYAEKAERQLAALLG